MHIYEMWPLSNGRTFRFIVFENGFLRRKLGPKRENNRRIEKIAQV
jgi:hypothetical protein